LALRAEGVLWPEVVRLVAVVIENERVHGGSAYEEG
jgi:hypothetical protein